MVTLTERDLQRVSDALRVAVKADPYEAVVDLPLVLQELSAWLADEHQWRSGRPQNWATLLNDLDAAWDKLGPNLRSCLDAEKASARKEAQSVRQALRQSNLPPDESMRRRLQRAADSINDELLRDRSLLAAWKDVVEATGPSATASAARMLLRLSRQHGHGSDSLVGKLRSILGDDYIEIAWQRDEQIDQDKVGQQAGSSVEERVHLAEKVLTELPQRADVVVWLLFALAPKMWPPILEVGDQVTLYDVAWLHAVDGSPQPSYPVPSELTEHGFGISMLTGDRGKESQKPNAVPYVAARISLRMVRVSEAEEIARASAEALIALASLQGGHSCPWLLEESYAMFIDGRGGPSSFAAPAVFEPSSQQSLAMSEDWTAEVIEKNAARWGRHLPIRDLRFQEAAHLLVWLRKARETWGPARLILCDRVIERVAGWAGLSSPRRLIADHLKIQWAITGMRSECANLAWAALHANDVFAAKTREEREERSKSTEEIRRDPDLHFDLKERSWSVSPRGTLMKLDWLEDRVPGGSRTAERIATLQKRTQTGASAAAWAQELMTDFSRLEARSRRVRNALIHGGPATDHTADQVLPFVEAVAENALFTSVEGRLDEFDLVDFFLDRRAKNMKILESLKQGASLVDVLWSPDGQST